MLVIVLYVDFISVNQVILAISGLQWQDIHKIYIFEKDNYKLKQYHFKAKKY